MNASDVGSRKVQSIWGSESCMTAQWLHMRWPPCALPHVYADSIAKRSSLVRPACAAHSACYKNSIGRWWGARVEG